MTKKRIKHKWKHGDRVKVALDAGITRSYMCHIIAGTRIPRASVAEKIIDSAYKHGYRLSLEEVLFPKRRKAGSLLSAE